MKATYSPEDNKLRLYSESRLDNETYASLKALGFKWAPKQAEQAGYECLMVAPAWSPSREDALLDLVDDIGDEDYSPEERSADRAERFENYRDKRREDAGEHADDYASGPSVYGHQNRSRAERQAARHDRHRTHALSQWGKAEYWQTRTAGVIRHALHKSSASVRRGRILTLEAEQRKQRKSLEEWANRHNAWKQVAELEGADQCVIKNTDEGYYGIRPTTSPAAKLAYTLANSGSCWGQYKHPRTGEEASLYSHMTDAQDPITAAEAAALYLESSGDPTDEDSSCQRWARHYELRLSYERAMLTEEGGSAAQAEMEVGGWIGSHQIHKVNKSNVTGLVVSVTLRLPGDRWGNSREGHHMQVYNIQRLPEGAYRAPTDEERQAFTSSTKERKAKEKASKPAAPSLINPTETDAQRLQDLWNAKAKAAHDEYNKKNHNMLREYQPATVWKMTQAQYSAASGGTYSHLETVEVCQHGHQPRRQYGENIDPSPIAFKVRKGYARTGCTTTAYRVVFITDKPAKALPLDWSQLEKKADPEMAGMLF